MGLNVGNLPVKAVYVGSTPVTAVYVGAEKIWPTIREVVQITLGAGMEARDQLRAALSARGLGHATVTEIPFDIEFVGTGVTRYLFQNCVSLTSVPAMDTSSVTGMDYMFYYCQALTHVPDMDTSNVTNMNSMFENCASLTDGNVRLIGRHPNVRTTDMIRNSGLTREPFYTTDGQPWPTAEVYEVSLTDVRGADTIHPLLTVTVPAGETWSVRIQGTVTRAGNNTAGHPRFRIGATTSGRYAQGAAVNFGGTISATDNTIAMVTGSAFFADQASFVGTVTIEK